MKSAFYIIGLALSAVIMQYDAYAGVGGGPFVKGFLRGTTSNDVVTGVAFAPNGDAVVTGWTESSGGWDNAPGYDVTFNGTRDAFVALCSHDLQTVKAFTYLGGASSEVPAGIVINRQGQITIAGTTESTNLPVTPGAFSAIHSGYSDGFVATFTSDLRSLVACTYFGGTKEDSITDVECDATGRVYISGSTRSIYGFPTANGYDKIHDGGEDGFLASLSINLALVHFSTYYGGTSDDIFSDITLDDSGNLMAAGSTRSQDFPTFPKVDPLYWWLQSDRPFDWSFNGGESDAVLAIFSTDGARCIVASLYGGSNADSATAVVLSVSGGVTLVGTTSSIDIPLASAAQGNLRGETDCFLAQFNETGRSLIKATYFGGYGNEHSKGATQYRGEQMVVLGTTTSDNLPTVGAGARNSLNGSDESFVAVTSLDGLVFLSTIGGAQSDVITRSAIEEDGGIVCVGSSTSSSIALDYDTLRSVGAAPYTDAWSFRLQRGVINLTLPAGAERKCFGQLVNVNWSRDEMQETDRYTVQGSTDLHTWINLASNISAGNANVPITNPSFADKLMYIRVVSTREHASRMATPLFVERAPSISGQPVGGVYCKGERFVLSVSASGTALKYQWRKNGIVLAGQTSSQLIVSNAVESSGGKYDVEVQAQCGAEVMSDVADITIPRSTEMVSHSTDTTVTAGATFLFEVKAVGADLRFQWYHNNVVLPNGTQYKLIISQATTAQSGEYRCEVTGTCGSVSSGPIVLLVKPVVSVGEEGPANLLLYPNPVSDILNVRVGPNAQNVTIFDSFGRIMREIELKTPDFTQIDVSRLAVGTYYLVSGKVRAPFTVLR